MTKNSFFENWMKPDFASAFTPAMKNAPFNFKEILESGRRSIQACSDAQQVAVESFQAIAKRQSEIMKQIVQDQSSIAKEVMAEGTTEEKIARSAELIREAYEKAYGATREVGDIANKSTREAYDILSARVSTALEEVQSTAEEVKEQKSKKSPAGKKAA